jgi:[protein-PII] uridylyltransferase
MTSPAWTGASPPLAERPAALVEAIFDRNMPSSVPSVFPEFVPFQREEQVKLLAPLTGNVKADFQAQRKVVEELHRSGASGHAVVRLQSFAMDRIVLALWERAVADAQAAGCVPTPVSLVALGGYGRKELAPWSDLDILVLHGRGEPTPFVRTASERLLYALWDLRLEVGYGVRDVPACEELAEKDHPARTALLDLRYMAGDLELFRELEREQLHGLSSAKVERFIQDKLAEMRERRERFGDSLYLLEPNIKQSEGGLRDLQSALWLARVRFKVGGITDLLKRAVLPDREVREMRRARDFVWRVRNELHYLGKRKTDQLTFDLQPLVAEAMGYRDGDAGRAVEQFMRLYYTAAKTVLIGCDAIVDRCLEPNDATGWRTVPAPATVLGAEQPVVLVRGKPPRQAERRLEGGEFKEFRGRITVTGAEVLPRSAAAVVRLFSTADREGLDLYPYARDQAAHAASEWGPEVAEDPEVNQEFLACFNRPGTRGRFLARMHELGVLHQIVPELKAITARRQIDVYHVYTVDVHTLNAVRRLLALRAGDVKEEPLTTLMQQLERPLPLYVGTLFHDVGKGSGKDHSIRGAELAGPASVRLGLDAADAADIEWLVLKHLRMAAIAQRRDLSDPDLIHAFAEEVGTVDRLRKLYLLTYADIATVGPGTWTDWKARLLKDLYEKTVAALGAGERRPEPGLVEAAGRTEAAKALAGHASEEDVARFVEALPPRYFLTEAPERAPVHLRLLRRGRRGVVATYLKPNRAMGQGELIVTAPDRPGLLATIAGVLAAHRIDIQHAEVFSTLPEAEHGWIAGRALDVFEVRGPEGGAVERERWRAARADLRRVLSGLEALSDLMARRLRASTVGVKPLPALKTKVVIDNASARSHSVIDVFTADRVGLLHTLAKTLFDLGLTVDLARISTEGHRALDAFYVRSATGGRLEGEGAQKVVEAIQQALSRAP